MTVLAFDWGGTGIKYGLWKNDQLEQKSSFATSNTWEELKKELKK